MSQRSGKFEVYQDRRGEWRWRLKAANGRILTASTEGYRRKRDCWKNLEAVRRAAVWPVQEFGSETE